MYIEFGEYSSVLLYFGSVACIIEIFSKNYPLKKFYIK